MTSLHGNRPWRNDRYIEQLLIASAQRALTCNETRRAQILEVLLAEAARLRSLGQLPSWLTRIAIRVHTLRK
jgi:hypothetical protein